MSTTTTASKSPETHPQEPEGKIAEVESVAALPSLPDPDSHPQTDVVLYDGHCLFCQRQVKRLHHWDGAGRLTFLSLHDPRVAARYPDLTHEQLMKQMYIVDVQGRRHGGAAAFRYLSRRLPCMWVLMPALHIPFSLPVWNWLYGHVARRRYLFGGVAPCADGACQIPVRPHARAAQTK